MPKRTRALNAPAAVAAAAIGLLGASRASEPVVVELFTSQACSSCLAAATYLEDLASRQDVVALGWHVDYWNTLQTRHGRWEDPYSKARYTARQRAYNRHLRATNAVYTPQMVIQGSCETIGSARAKIEALIEETRKSAASGADIIGIKPAPDGRGFEVSARGAGEAWLVYFEPHAETTIETGENAGARFVDVNVVTDVEYLGALNGEAAFSARAPASGERCAALVQEAQQGRILAARYCPLE